MPKRGELALTQKVKDTVYKKFLSITLRLETVSKET